MQLGRSANIQRDNASESVISLLGARDVTHLTLTARTKPLE